MAAMSGMHREIFRLVRLLAQMTEALPPDGPDADGVREFQRLLYGLDAIVRLHCAQEDELFHVLGDEGASSAGARGPFDAGNNETITASPLPSIPRSKRS